MARVFPRAAPNHGQFFWRAQRFESTLFHLIPASADFCPTSVIDPAPPNLNCDAASIACRYSGGFGIVVRKAVESGLGPPVDVTRVLVLLD
jgi:hypothetical protein